MVGIMMNGLRRLHQLTGDRRAADAIVGAARWLLSQLGALSDRALLMGDGFLDEVWPDILERFGAGALGSALTRWCIAEPKPVVLLIDEIDSLIGDTLISVLRQLRAGYDQRPDGFPQSVLLCGVRDVRDYRIHSSSENMVITGGSAFNIRAESLRVGDFTEAQMRALLAQHTAATGQAFTSEALNTVWKQTCGQPWLVNALAARRASKPRLAATAPARSPPTPSSTPASGSS